MIATRWRWPILLAAVALLASPAFAQLIWEPKVKIESARFGFRTVGSSSEYGAGQAWKIGAWAPVSFGLEYQKDTRVPMRVEIATYDGDGTRVATSFPIVDGIPESVDPPAKGTKVERTELNHTPYVRVGAETSAITLRIVSDDGKASPLSDTQTYEQPGAQSPSRYFILSLGTSLPGFGFVPKGTDQSKIDLRESRVQLARLDTVEEMPDNWFGYEAVDLLVLPTGRANEEFLASLFGGAKAERKRRALFEWVRRGGKLVLSAGQNADIVRASVEFGKVLPAAIGQVVRESSVPFSLKQVTGTSNLVLGYRERKPATKAQQAVVSTLGEVVFPDTLPLVELKSNPAKSPFQILVSESGGDKRPLVVQAPLGLGRITMVAFDLDRSPFVDNPKRVEFWEWLVENAGSELAAEVPAKSKDKLDNTTTSVLTGVGPQDGISSAIRKNIDTFEGVPVISFGWVALFILAYTIIIGPLEYLFLKKVLGKLELTWITFPLIVLTVSLAAYLTAYAVKGKDLRINKIDTVDVDLRAKPARVYGRTWFTLFSPLVDSYTIGVEPKAGWGQTIDENGYSPVTTVDWFGYMVQNNALANGGSGRAYTAEINPLGDDRRGTDANAQSLQYANGLSGVPIHVWSTKSFTANWSSYLDADATPVESDLRHLPKKDSSGLPEAFDGKVTIKLPMGTIQDAYAMYRGKVYKQSNVSVGIPFRVSLAESVPANEIFKNDARFSIGDGDDSPNDAFGNRRKPSTKLDQAKAAIGTSAPIPLFAMLFHEKATGTANPLENASLRSLDLSWRANDRNSDEVLLLLKLKRDTGPSEPILTGAEGNSPSVLWLKGLPGRDKRKPVEGLMQQDTYVRLLIPVKASGGK